ncbi:MAG: serine/threonine transporter SstT [Eggerthellaceae bacterium]|nr:serine/threonine transporter SstT [Eggerthellaceae bacterium]MCH4220367.1 serine/threonine transporter SstT [Eggerthellaceae bacterium]
MHYVKEKWNKVSFIQRIILGMIVGILLALFVPNIDALSLLGTLYVAALKAVAPILVFCLVIAALCKARAQGAMKHVILLFAISTFIAALVAVIACAIFPITLTLTDVDSTVSSSPSSFSEVFHALLMNLVANPIDALAKANFLGILAWAVLIGIALRIAAESTKTMLTNLSDAVSQIVRWVIDFVPFGVCGLVYNAVSTSGLSIFTEYGTLLIVLVGCMLIVALVTNPLIVFINIRQNPYPLVFRCLKDSGITAFFTRSSAANIPVNLELCRKLGLNKDNYSVSIPLGATINMAGAAVTISVMALATAHTVGINVDPITAVILCVLASLSAAGTSGVAGGSLLLIPLACSLFGINNDIAMQVVGVGFIIGVIQDSCETALNSSSCALFAATADYYLRRKQGKEMNVNINLAS